MIIFMIFLKTTEFSLQLNSSGILPFRVDVPQPIPFYLLEIRRIMKAVETLSIGQGVVPLPMQREQRVQSQPFREFCPWI